MALMNYIHLQKNDCISCFKFSSYDILSKFGNLNKHRFEQNSKVGKERNYDLSNILYMNKYRIILNK